MAIMASLYSPFVRLEDIILLKREGVVKHSALKASREVKIPRDNSNFLFADYSTKAAQ
jgi:hypothetical protein